MRTLLPAFVLLALSATVAAADTASLAGLTHSSLGGARLTLTGSGFGSRALQINNLGSSGQDGVAIQLPNSNGWMGKCVAPANPTPSPIIHRDLALRAVVSGALTNVVVQTLDQVGSNVQVTCTSPGIQQMLVQLWDGDQMVYSASHPSGTIITIYGATLDAAGTEFGAYSRSKKCPDCPPGHVTLIKRTTSSDMSIGGNTFHGTGVTCTFDATTSYRCQQLAMRWKSSGGGSGGSIAIDEEGVAEDPGPSGGSPKPHLSLPEVVSGILLTGTSDGQLMFSPDGSGDPMEMRLNGLPPGVPWEYPPGKKAKASFSTDYMTGAGPSTMTCKSTEVCGNGVTDFDVNNQVTWTASAVTGFDYSFSTDDPTTSPSAVVLNGGSPVAHSPTPFSLSTNHPPVSCAFTVYQRTTLFCASYPPGTTATCNGATVPCDSAVIPFKGNYDARRISDVRIVHPPGSPPGTWRGFETTPDGGTIDDVGLDLDTFAAEPGEVLADEVTLSDGERRLPVRNLGSSGQDGVEINLGRCRGARIGGLEGGIVGLRSLSVTAYPPPYPCAGLDCDFSSRLVLNGLGTSVASVSANYPAQGNHPLSMEAGGYTILLEADTDGDGTFDDIEATVPRGVVVTAIDVYQRTSLVESQTVHFADPVQVKMLNHAVVVNELTVWRNRGGGTQGSPSPEPAVVRLNGLPPGEPVIGTRLGVSDLDLDPPAVVSTGPEVDFDNGGSYAGHPIVETWTQVKGPLAVADLDRDGRLDLVVGSPLSLQPGWSSSGSLDASFHTPSPQGCVVTEDLPARSALGNGSSGRHQLRGILSGTEQVVFDVTASTGGGSSSISITPTVPGSYGWEVRYIGGVQGTRSGTSPLSVTNPPSSFVFAGDLDGDGIPDLVCAGFPAGTKATVGGQLKPCDEVRIHFTADPLLRGNGTQDATTLTGIEMLTSGIQMGDGGLTGVTIAEVGTQASVSAPPPAPRLETLWLASPMPNPGTDGTTLRWSIAQAGNVRARVLDIAGREVASLANSRFPAGEHTVHWNGRLASGSRAPAGLYFVRVEHEGAAARTVRFTVLR